MQASAVCYTCGGMVPDIFGGTWLGCIALRNAFLPVVTTRLEMHQCH
jgi:hypothetical protein